MIPLKNNYVLPVAPILITLLILIFILLFEFCRFFVLKCCGRGRRHHPDVAITRVDCFFIFDSEHSAASE